MMIANNLWRCRVLRTPIICTVIGEGGSGGGRWDRCRRSSVDDAVQLYYSVISPEGCSGILWKEGDSHKEEAAAAMRITSRDLLKLGVIEDRGR